MEDLPECIMETMEKSQEGGLAGPANATNPTFLCVTARSPKGSAQFVLPETCTIQEFKEEIAKRFSCEAGQVVLVFFGRLLKNQDTLRQCGVHDGMTVHLVIRSLKSDQEDPPRPSYLPKPPVCVPTLSMDGNITTPTFSLSSERPWVAPERNPSSAECPVVPTSEMIVQKVRQVILANPEIQQLAQQIPAISHILNNTDIMTVILDKMREIMGPARTPEMMQAPKSQDQALLSVPGNVPGGDNSLRRRDSEIQEPGRHAVTQDVFAPSPYATLVRNPRCEVTNQGLRMGNSERMDSLPISYSSTSICTTSTLSDEGGASNSWVNPLGYSTSMPNLGPGSGTGRFNPGGPPNPYAAEIPMLIVNLCNAYTKRMMFSLMHNALLASQGTHPAQQEQMNQQVLHLSQQMQSPEMMTAMSNPKAIQAWVQMEQGLQTLAAEAPILLPWFMLRLRGLGNMAGWNQGPSEPSCQEPVIPE